jgi:glycerol-3-phosphate acyltransferase PlsY
MIGFIFFSVLAYLMGSLSSAVIISRLLQLPDPREHGSKNPGATNVLRSGNKTAAGLVLLCDIIKGIIPVLFAKLLHIHGFPLATIGIFAVLGHIFPCFFDFKGGKGVATAIGIIIGLSWLIGLGVLIVWIAVAATTRYSSLAALCAIASAPIFNEWFSDHRYFLALVLLGLIIFIRHAENISRLLENKEHKIGGYEELES